MNIRPICAAPDSFKHRIGARAAGLIRLSFFHNDTGERYNPVAAKAAWDEALDWFDKYLKA